MLGATGSVEGLRELLREQPDLLVMDLRMKPLDGLAMLEQIRKEGCSTPAVILTMSDSEADLANAIRAGVRGYLLKDMAPEEAVDAIRRVAAGELVSRGESNKAIAQTLSISYDTVKQHVRHILTKLNLSSRVKAAVLFTVEQQTHNGDDKSLRF